MNKSNKKSKNEAKRIAQRIAELKVILAFDYLKRKQQAEASSNPNQLDIDTDKQP